MFLCFVKYKTISLCSFCTMWLYVNNQDGIQCGNFTAILLFY